MSARVLAAVWVPGVPRTQGSMEHIGGGKMRHSDALVAWRSLVKSEIARDMRLRNDVDPGSYRGPVAVRCVFVRGDGLGDIDKLARCVLDALEASRVIADDVQVVKLICDRVTTVKGRGDGAFVLVATVVDEPQDSPLVAGAYGAEIEGWVGR